MLFRNAPQFHSHNMKISIITAAFNSGSTIADTLKSVSAQTYQNIDHIIIDGASKDNTLVLVKEHGARVSTIVSEPDRGIYDAYNKGIAMATGEIIGMLNSDDLYFSNDVIGRVMKEFENPEIDACYADLVYVDKDDTSKIVRYWKSAKFSKGDFLRGFVPAHPTLFLRREVYQKCGLFNPEYRLAADYEFMLRIFEKHGVSSTYIPELFVRMRTGGATGKNLANILKQNKEILKALHSCNFRVSMVGMLARKVVDRSIQYYRAF